MSQEEVELARRTLDERTFKQEFSPALRRSVAACFRSSDDTNVAEDVADTGGPVLGGPGFQRGSHGRQHLLKVGDTLHQWDEIAVKNSNTSKVAQMLAQRFLTGGSSVIPDPTGRARKDQRSRRDRSRHPRKYGLEVVAPKSPWSVKDRLNATNWLICNAEGQRRMFIHIPMQEHD